MLTLQIDPDDVSCMQKNRALPPFLTEPVSTQDVVLTGGLFTKV
jgi:hypothetical protein